MPKITVTGIDELQKALKSNVTMNDVKRVVRQNGSEMNEKIVKNADFNKGYQTGRTKGSVHLTITDAGLTAESGATTEYAEYLENGTRFMEAQPFVKPAFEEQKKIFERDLNKITR